MVRILNVLVIGCLIVAAVIVYDVKYQSTYKAQAVARLNNEIRAEQEKIALLRAEWSRLSSPVRIQTLSERYLGMKALDVSRIDDFSALPEKPAPVGDPIRDMIETLGAPTEAPVTGSAGQGP